MRLARLCLLIALSGAAFGCGQKGPLVLPDTPPKHKRTVPKLPQTPAKPAGTPATPAPAGQGAAPTPVPPASPSTPSPTDSIPHP